MRHEASPPRCPTVPLQNVTERHGATLRLLLCCTTLGITTPRLGSALLRSAALLPCMTVRHSAGAAPHRSSHRRYLAVRRYTLAARHDRYLCGAWPRLAMPLRHTTRQRSTMASRRTAGLDNAATEPHGAPTVRHTTVPSRHETAPYRTTPLHGYTVQCLSVTSQHRAMPQLHVT